MSDRLWRDAEMYEADEGTGSMEQDAERRWVVPVEPVATLTVYNVALPESEAESRSFLEKDIYAIDDVVYTALPRGRYAIVRLNDE